MKTKKMNFIVMLLHSIAAYIQHYMEQLSASLFAVTSGVILFGSLPNVQFWFIVGKFFGVIFFSAIGAVTGFFVKRYLEKKFPK